MVISTPSQTGRTPLEAARRNAGLSREQLAVKAGVSIWTIGRIERRDATPRRAIVLALALALDLAPSDLNENERPATTPDARETRPGDGRHDAA